MHAEFPERNVVVSVLSRRIKVNLLCFQFLLVQVSLILIQTKTNQQSSDVIIFMMDNVCTEDVHYVIVVV